MIRSSAHTIKFANRGKRDNVKEFLAEEVPIAAGKVKPMEIENMAVKPRDDKTGRTFGVSKILGYAPEKSLERVYWKARCTCGNTFYISNSNLVCTAKMGRFVSCGCMRGQGNKEAARHGVLGKRFGRLTVLEFVTPPSSDKRAYVACHCDCGSTIECSLNHLRTGNTKSCGCLAREKQSQSGIEHHDRNSRSASRRSWVYKDTYFRSGLEVMYAIVLERNDIQYEYEPRVFVLRPNIRYKPDFYLPDTDEWIEVKGFLSRMASEKIRLFRRENALTVLRKKDI